MEMGSAVSVEEGLLVSPNESGQVYITLPHQRVNLSEQRALSIDFGGKPPPVIFVIWHNDIQPEQTFQIRLPRQLTNPAMFDLENVQGWEGRATRLGIGLRLAPDSQLVLRSISLGSPNLLTAVRERWRNWGHFRPWKQSDINVYTGTREFGEGPHPVPFFAVLSMLGLAGYFALSRISRRRFSLRTAGAVVLCAWLALDVFWQLRLYQQVALTVRTFGGLDTGEKLLASEDAALVRFTASAKEKIPDKDARVFIASASDGQGMRSAYYMSPLNTYWHRKGPELPDPALLGAGDYLLVVAPSAIRYNPGEGRIRYTNNAPVAVETLLREPSGLLLRVAE